jgi:hypothetical protein
MQSIMTAKEMLQKIDDFLLSESGSGEAKRLWDVLGAIRGPDSSQDSKTVTTAVIRGRAFPRTYAAGLLSGEASGAPLSTINTKGLNSHFASHIAAAKQALLSMYFEAPPAPVAAPSGAGLYDAQAALVQLGKVQD